MSTDVTTGVPSTFSWRQPRNPCLWLFVVLVGYGLYYTVTLVRGANTLYTPALGISAAIFAAYAVPFWWFTTRIDRYSRIPASLTVAAFVYGGFAATWVIALNGNTALSGLYSKLVSPTFAQNWSAALSAPVFEELGKGSAVLLLLLIAPRVIRTAYDGFIVGAFVGLGFEIIEDTLYALNSASEGFGTDPVGSSLQTVVLRLATGFTSHIAYAAIFGAGIVYVVGTRWQTRRTGRGLLLCATAMLLHGVWDAAAVLSGGNLAVLWTLLIVAVAVSAAIVISVFATTVAPERAALRAAMEPEVAGGSITDEELDALVGDRKARKAYRRAGHGHGVRRAREHRLEAAHDLADELGRTGGRDDERVAHARAELDRLEAAR